MSPIIIVTRMCSHHGTSLEANFRMENVRAKFKGCSVESIKIWLCLLFWERDGGSCVVTKDQHKISGVTVVVLRFVLFLAYHLGESAHRVHYSLCFPCTDVSLSTPLSYQLIYI